MTKKSNKKIKGSRKPVDLSNKTLTIVFPTYWCINDKVHENYGGLEPRTFAVAKLFADEGCTVNILAPRGSETKHKNINVLSGSFRAWDGKNPHPYDLEKDLVLSNIDVIKQSDAFIDDDHFHYLTYLKSKNPDDFPIGAWSFDHHPDVLESLPIYPQNIICVSKWQMSALREKFRHLNHRFYQSYSGLVLENYPTDFDPKDKQDNLYLYLARFSSVKAPHLVMHLAEENPLDEFVLLGDTLFAGEYQYIRKVKEAADELDNVKIIFNCSYKEKIEYLRKSIGLLHPGFWCIPGYETIMTSDGMKSISSIEIGDEVLTHDGTFQKVLNKFSKAYSRDLIRVHPRHFGGRYFDVTPEHKIMTRNGYKQACKLMMDDELLQGKSSIDRLNSKNNKEYVNIYKLQMIPYSGIVYDIEVKNNHNFNLKGVVVSNSEPLGLDMLEGLYFGNKVYAFDRGGPREIYKPQDHGLIIPWGPNQEENAELYLRNFKTFKGLKINPEVCRERVLSNFDFKRHSFGIYRDVLFSDSK